MAHDTNTNIAISTLNKLEVKDQNVKDSPNYYASNPASLISTSNVSGLAFGTGHDIYVSSIIPAIRQANQEVILVTCFWARSTTLDALNEALRELSAKGLHTGSVIRVRICFSSSSLLQKLFHERSPEGTTYAPSKWRSKLGLPSARELQGLDLEVKSIFFLPFSVMHSKFVIVDRARVCLPSCNVSWENWFEGCVELGGDVVVQFVEFWMHFWASESDRTTTLVDSSGTASSNEFADDHDASTVKDLRLRNVPSVFLPSPHHVNPRFRFPWQSACPPPPTPLNTYLSTLISQAGTSVRIQTPNLTVAPVRHALSLALWRGVEVTIMTSEHLMIAEQLVTASTMTSRYVKKLIRMHKTQLKTRREQRLDDLEAGFVRSAGRLKISYYTPRQQGVERLEPVQSHLKLTIIDNRYVVFGSGNLDRASWYTSQELGVAFISTEMVAEVGKLLDEVMEGRSRVLYDSGV